MILQHKNPVSHVHVAHKEFFYFLCFLLFYIYYEGLFQEKYEVIYSIYTIHEHVFICNDRKKKLNSDGQQFHQYEQNEQSHFT